MEVDLLAPHQHHAAVRLVHAAEDANERALARAVLADECMDLARREREVDSAHRAHAAKGLAHALELGRRAAERPFTGLCLYRGLSTHGALRTAHPSSVIDHKAP